MLLPAGCCGKMMRFLQEGEEREREQEQEQEQACLNCLCPVLFLSPHWRKMGQWLMEMMNPENIVKISSNLNEKYLSTHWWELSSSFGGWWGWWWRCGWRKDVLENKLSMISLLTEEGGEEQRLGMYFRKYLSRKYIFYYYKDNNNLIKFIM